MIHKNDRPTAQDTEQYRAGFEAWAIGPTGPYGGKVWLRRKGGQYAEDCVEARWQGWAAAKREASTEPSAGYGPVQVVGDLVRNLLTLDQAAPIYAAFHVDFDGRRRCRTRAVMTSWERVVDGKWIESSRIDVPYSVIVWAKPQTDEVATGALTDDAKDAALVEIGDRLANALEVMSTAIRNKGSSEFVTSLVAEWRAAAIEAKSGSGT